MGKIYQLDDLLSNKIAAGEVVERPASVVKELVENSLDANSTNIRVDIEEGGLSLIRVLDNGEGIEEDDIETAFHRHATSKIREDQDLFKIATLGFRGEALPSIASVSKLTLKTSDGTKEGQEIRIEGGRIVHKGSTSSRKGTEIQVSDIFYNTPARLKYLRTIHTELGHISDCLNRMALSHPNVAFHLTHNGKTLLKTSGNGDLLKVIASIYGTSVAKKMMPFEAESLDFKVKGFIAKPEVTRSNRSYMSTIINGRYIRNYMLMKAVQEGYHTLLPIGKFPIVVLHIDMDPILVDVNVHPSKLEVRISKEQALQELLTKEIKQLFKNTQLIPEVKKTMYEKPKSEQISFQLRHDHTEKERRDDHFEHNRTIDQREDHVKETKQAVLDQPEVIESVQTSVDEKENDYIEKTVVESTYTAQTNEQASKQAKIDPSIKDDEREGEEGIAHEVPTLYPIGQLHGTYILAQNDQGLYIVDQHAAQERIKYEFFREKVRNVDRTLQDLLVPLTFEFTQKEEERIKEHSDMLKEVGVYLEPFGTRTYIVRSYPTWFPKGQEQEVIEEMIEQLKEKNTIDIGKIRDDAAILMSCKAAIKANRYLTHDEMFQLLETIRSCEEAYTCPHGRPILLHFSTYEMERMFKRVM
ncbi:DNA mismatch repair endonuclease MutL [Bacillus shivajii]|uniref:DNA mismatch repair endonuclease MutL n=1 Tax=Bacillus shivajii TaxID=1983719 RepID=UPI001CF95590|nr:DNA mismatch repair endonuclease MutL [Bacillus shivajii]UCZ51642.1 DNA mismatch repair endonuclease MutL [Bacillus shivajii]